MFVGALIGGVVPFLFSSMLIRAVGRAAFLIVKECRMQFRDKEIWAGTKKPDYGRVVNICTAAAQGELIGPALLAILMPILVGIFLGTQALGGYLAGMIIVGQLLAVFMANAGGAWDNAKKLIEDGIYGGKGSEAHKAAVTGDTVGDPLERHGRAGLNPLIKVMNMVSLLAIAPIILWQEHHRWLYAVGLVLHRWVLPGRSGAARRKARSSGRWRQTSPVRPRPTSRSKPRVWATEIQYGTAARSLVLPQVPAACTLMTPPAKLLLAAGRRFHISIRGPVSGSHPRLSSPSKCWLDWRKRCWRVLDAEAAVAVWVCIFRSSRLALQNGHSTTSM